MRILCLSALFMAGYLLSGCGALGASLQVAGALTGQKSLSNAGSSMSRASETKDFNDEEKYYTGRTVAADLLTSNQPSDNSALEAYVNQVGQTLSLAAGNSAPFSGWHFILLEDSSPNAFACPGGIIFVSKGLLNLCQSEDELAGALAHEISHIALDHPMKAISAANQRAALMSLAEFGVATAMKDSKLSSLTGAFNQVVKEVGKVVAHGYDRGTEAEADKAAVQMLVESGYDPRGLKRVLERLKGSDASHGDPSQRAQAVEKEAYGFEPVPKLLAARTSRFSSAIKK